MDSPPSITSRELLLAGATRYHTQGTTVHTVAIYLTGLTLPPLWGSVFSLVLWSHTVRLTLPLEVS